MGTTFTQLMHADHQRCDQLLAASEEKLFSGDQTSAKEQILQFIEATLNHLKAEEEILFPALEAATGMQGGPTMVMRMEHDQMRGLLTTLQAATVEMQQDQVGSITETLMILMQQHNLKEENMLYPMMDNALGVEREKLVAKVSQLL